MAFTLGTYVQWKTITYLDIRKRAKVNKSYIDELILFEQRVNSLNGPFILMQLLALVIPVKIENSVLCVVMEVILALTLFHRALGGAGIAGVRQVHYPPLLKLNHHHHNAFS